METEFAKLVLPRKLLKYFMVKEIKELGDISTKKMIYEMHLEEKNEVPAGYSADDYESKGFLSSARVQDFPIRGKAVYLVIKRRRWRHKKTKKGISRDFRLVAEGSKLTNELSDFLKETGRDPRRYDH